MVSKVIMGKQFVEGAAGKLVLVIEKQLRDSEDLKTIGKDQFGLTNKKKRANKS